MISIFERIEKWVTSKPDQLLFAFLDISGNETEKYSYSEFFYRIDAIASHLQHEHGFKAGDRVLLAYPAGLEMICAFFACARIGAIPVPAYPPTSHGFESSLNKMTFIAKDCKAKAILTSRDYFWTVKLNLSRTNIESFFNSSYMAKLSWINTEDFRDPHRNGLTQGHSDILFLQYTSGSTSEPKGVMVSHENILHNGDLATEQVPLAVSWLPQYHDMGLIGYYIYIAIKGGTTYGLSPLDFIQRPALWLESISKYKATHSSAPNFAFEYCLQPGKISEKTLENLDLSSLEYLMTAAEPVIPHTYTRFLEFFKPYGLKPDAFFAAYGLAENTLAVSNYGRTYVSVDKAALKQNKLKVLPLLNAPNEGSNIMSCGAPLGDIGVRIVDPETRHALKEGQIGEVWLAGKSKCLGYWQKPELTKEHFQATIVGENQNANNYLRTGDIGFLYQDELYICGRAKDMIIIRGSNYYPQDIEKIVEAAAHGHVRHGFTAAFDIFEGEEKLVVVVGVKNPKSLPDPVAIVDAIRKGLNVQTHIIAFVSARDIPKTSSGKIMRHKAKELWEEGKFNVLREFSGAHEVEHYHEETVEGEASPFEDIKRKYGLTGNETYSLGKAGLESIDLAVLMHDIKELLKDKGADALAKQIDIRLIQEITISELFELVKQFESATGLAVLRLKNMLTKLQKEHTELEQRMMLSDVHLTFDPPTPVYPEVHLATNVLLTGGTGFFGPFILKGILEQTKQRVYVLIRASNEEQGMERLIAAMNEVEPMSQELLHLFKTRVIPVCGDLGQHQLGLSREKWNFLANNVQEIYHNGATVNYLFNYDKMRNVNVIGTNEILKMAFDGTPKVFNHISTTFIFGWAVRDVLYEYTSNDDINLLDFGYSQTKWVSEEVVKDAMRRGLKGRIFRPALITPSIHGGGHNFDISIRLLAFMINNGIGVDAQNQVSFSPADVAANNIVAISNMPHTINQTYHVVRDVYNNMKDITDIISNLTGVDFHIYKLEDFVPAIIDRCTKDDLLFPLLDFLVRSVENISAMEFKLYDSANYKAARDESPWGRPDPSLEETVKGILLFLQKNGIIQIPTEFEKEAVRV